MANPMTMSDPVGVCLGSLGPATLVVVGAYVLWVGRGDNGRFHDNVRSLRGLYRVSGYELLREVGPAPSSAVKEARVVEALYL